MVIRNIEAILTGSKKYIVSATSGAYFHPLSLSTGLAGGWNQLSTCCEILLILGQVDGHPNKSNNAKIGRKQETL